MVIDSHVHIGRGSSWGDFPPEFLLEILNNIDSAICSNLEGIESSVFKNEFDCNINMLKISQKYPKLKPLVVCQPNISENEDTIRTLLEKHREFIGLKFHPECMRLPADSPLYDKYLKLAQEFKKPCLYHSGHIKSRFSSPELIYKKAQEFPDVPIILGHLSTGSRNSHEAAINILLDSIEKENSTLYVDTSWIDFIGEKLNPTMEDTLLLIERLKHTSKGDYTHRILWASDAPVGKFNQSQNSYEKNLNVFKDKVLERFKSEKLLNDLLFNNAKNLYKI
jgi:predicted TIM-barrel fold metal-dependent hydrolase